ncbi:hypothetical protein KFK09_013745 [Dendrobium nobile]|uniref:Uncharacterized protein n=1 Tax=Dendrobium nobile TaxID=94219 RepID=A0A8T3BDW4_DENNO|nr:hypothetical protein KFK09_013745 [Dendrobium nobile]
MSIFSKPLHLVFWNAFEWKTGKWKSFLKMRVISHCSVLLKLQVFSLLMGAHEFKVAWAIQRACFLLMLPHDLVEAIFRG